MDMRGFASLAVPLQQARSLRLYVAALPHGQLVAESMQGWEAIDAGYRLQITALSVDARFDLRPCLGQPALLELQTDLGDRRPFHGLVTAIQRLGSNGGLARYQLCLEPGLAMLGHAQDTYVFRQASWQQITEQILGWHPTLAPPICYRLGQTAPSPILDQWTLYETSPLQGLQRLWADEGVYWFYEHAGDPAQPALGSHTLVLADHNAAFAPATPTRYAFHRRDATEAFDTIQQLQPQSRLRSSEVTRRSRDYRSRDDHPASSRLPQHPVLADHDVPGPYAWHNREQAQRRANQHLDSLRRDSHSLTGAGGLRRLTVGQRFSIRGHARLGAEQAWICRRQHFQARNNLSAEVIEAAHTLGQLPADPPSRPATLNPAPALPVLPHTEMAQDLTYHTVFEAFPAELAYRPGRRDGHGRHPFPRPVVPGLLPGIVVGNGEALDTDRDHRLHVQLVSRRGQAASSGLNHPGGADNAPARSEASAWVRVSTPLAGDNFGAVWLPRVGQLVYLTSLEGQADRLSVLASGYNGRGNPEAPHNQIGNGPAGATGNAPAWFEDSTQAAVLSGIKTQALSHSADGSGDHNRLLFDASPGRERLELATTQADSGICLGHLRQQQDQRLQADRGYGIETRTTAGAALRAGSGLLLSSEPGTAQLSAPLALAQLQQSAELIKSLAASARDLRAQPLASEAAVETQAAPSLDEIAAAMATHRSEQPSVPTWSLPLQVLSSPAGIAALTAGDLVAVSGQQTIHTAAEHIHWTVGQELAIRTAHGLQCHTQGQPPAAAQASDTGITLHAASGAVQIRALANTIHGEAQQALQLASTGADVLLAARASHLLATAGGAYLKLQGGHIELAAPGNIEFKATRKVLAEPRASHPPDEAQTSHPPAGCAERLSQAAGTGALMS